jgi:hypothetical protein
MTVPRTVELTKHRCKRGGIAASIFPVLLLIGPTTGLSSSTGPSENVARLTTQGTAQFVQDVRTIHSGAIVVQPEQSRVRHTGLFSQSIDRPTPFVKDFSELADNHVGNLAGSTSICQPNHIYEVYFTYHRYRSRVAPCLRGSRTLDVQWKTTATSLRAGISRTFPGLLSSANGGRA